MNKSILEHGKSFVRLQKWIGKKTTNNHSKMTDSLLWGTAPQWKILKSLQLENKIGKAMKREMYIFMQWAKSCTQECILSIVECVSTKQNDIRCNNELSMRAYEQTKWVDSNNYNNHNVQEQHEMNGEKNWVK